MSQKREFDSFLPGRHQMQAFITLQLKVPNIDCSACVTTITNVITVIAPTAKVEADSKTKLVNIETQHSVAAVKQAIVLAGYSVAQ